LTHADAAGRVRMVDVAAKPETRREARAVAVVRCSEQSRRLLREGRLAKGDGLAVARIAGIQAAKRASWLIPLCHALPLTAVDIDIAVGATVVVAAQVATVARTGVEMEALTAAAVAGLTVIDMIKSVDRAAGLESVKVVAKSGGASGAWADGGRVAAAPPAGVVTVSDRCAAGARADQSGPLIVAALERAGASVVARVVPDQVEAIRSAVLELVDAGRRLVITTGGTGLSPRDVTPEALGPLLAAPVPGLAEAVRAIGARAVASAALSRSVAGVVERGGRRALVLAAPGSPQAAAETAALIAPLAAHIVDQLDGLDHAPPAAASPAAVRAGGAGPEAGGVGPDTGGAGPEADGTDGRIVEARVGPQPIDPSALEAAVRRAESGSVVSFVGAVRDHDGGRRVTRVDYEAHPAAGRELGRLLAAWLAERPQVQAVAARHRTGALAVGEVAFAAVVATAHRAEGFAACAELVDRVKAGLPAWKRQHFADGSDEWVGS
jgi:molybdenum cofactor biosynthesis protein MoaC